MGRVAWRYLGQYGRVGQVLSPSIITLLRAQIAARVGYASASTFTTAFVRHVGIPPARYARGFRDLSGVDA